MKHKRRSKQNLWIIKVTLIPAEPVALETTPSDCVDASNRRHKNYIKKRNGSLQ